MPQQTKIFRVFVSSTFTDMKEERRLFQRDVFPRLESFCEENGARFQAVDLRWGVNEESQLNQKTLEICLNEIRRCQRISPKPNFLILLGDKYGWQPVPSRIPENEMEVILHELKNGDKELIQEWYKKDSNAIPAEYVLQPRGDEYTSYEKWETIETSIRKILRSAVAPSKLPPGQEVKYFASATHQEILAGTLSPDPGLERPEDHVLVMVRQIQEFPRNQSAEGFIDLTEGKQDPYCETRLNNLKKELLDKLGSHYVPYQAKWDNGSTQMLDPELFKDQVYGFLSGIIQDQVKKIISPDEIEHEVGLHKEFMNKLTENFCGREVMLRDIQLYLHDESEKRTLGLIGESGSGKSSVMAKAVALARETNKNAVTVYRFIGTTSKSSTIISFLQSICGQIAREFNTTLEDLAGEGREKALHDMNGMSEIFRKCLALGTESKPVVLFLDALDQLSEADNAKALNWLPKVLPEHAKVVISALPDLEQPLSGSRIQHLPLLPEQEARTILDRWLHSVNRALTREQQGLVLSKFNHTKLPIYLKLAFEQARKWHSYDIVTRLSDDVTGIINDFMTTLEADHTRDLTEHALSYMLSGRYQGLTEGEILEILVFDRDFWENIFLEKITHKDHKQELIGLKKEIESSGTEPKRAMKIPIVVWSRFFLDLEPFLTERDADGVPIITFFHGQFIEILKERYHLNDIKGERPIEATTWIVEESCEKNVRQDPLRKRRLKERVPCQPGQVLFREATLP